MPDPVPVRGGAGQSQGLGDQVLQLGAHGPHQGGEVGPAGGGDEPFVPDQDRLQFAVAGRGAEQQVQQQLHEFAPVVAAARQFVEATAALGEFEAPPVFDRRRDQVVQRVEVVGGGGEREIRAFGDGAVPDRVEPALAEEFRGGGHQ